MAIKPAGKFIISVVALGSVYFGLKHFTKVLDSKSQTKSALATPKGEPFLKFAGSTTIGDSLITLMASSYLQNLGAHDIQENSSGSEKQLTANLNGKDIYIQISAHGTQTGFDALQDKTADICMASAPIDDKISSTFTGEDMRSHDNEHIIGLDGIAIIVNVNNPVKEFSLEQLKKIYSGELTDWSAFGGNGKIEVDSRDNNSGTFKTFSESVMNKEAIVTGAQQYQNSTDMITEVGKNPNAIGFISFAFTKNQPSIKTLAIKPGEHITASLPNILTMKTERYPLCRRLYLYTVKSNTNANINGFINYAIGENGQSQVETLGFVSLKISIDRPLKSGTSTEYQDLSVKAEKSSIEFRFRLGKADLDSRSIDDISRLVEYISTPGKNRKVILVGFTDNSGSPQRNIDLSLTRANTIKDELTKQGVDIKDVKGFGDQMPVHSNDNEIERSLNRRVEVWITKN
jgi:phosphate transport system substrate-binding protein